MLFLLTIVLQGSMFESGRGIRKMDGRLYLTGGFRGGWVIYSLKAPPGTYVFRVSVDFSKMKGDAGIYVKRGKGWRLWESTDRFSWSSSRPEYLPIEEESVWIAIRAEGGFFSRERFIIDRISFDFKSLPDSVMEKIKEYGGEVKGGFLYIGGFGRYKGLKSQRRAMAIRAAKMEAVRKASIILRRKKLTYEEVEREEGEDGINVVIRVPLLYE